MPKTLEQRMTENGWTAQELADVASMLGNAKFRKTIEDQLNAADTLVEQNAKLTRDLDTYDKWFTDEISPAHTAAIKKAEDAIADKAAAEARLKYLQETGMRRQAANQDPAVAQAEADRVAAEAAEAARRAGQPQPKYVSADTFQNAFESTGDAIADAYDLGMDYQELFGNRLNMKQMRLEAKAARMPVRAYVENKFNFNVKRQEISTKATADHEAKIRADERQKLMVEFGGSNPNMRVLSPSVSPFVSRKKVDAGKQPWERNENELTTDRIQKAVVKAAERGELATA